jgi:hypothetical protein
VIYDVDRAAMRAKVFEWYESHQKELPWDEAMWERLQAIK